VGYETEAREVGRWFTGLALALATLAAAGSLVWFSRIP
jgi:Ca-activated chloride channel family protein